MAYFILVILLYACGEIGKQDTPIQSDGPTEKTTTPPTEEIAIPVTESDRPEEGRLVLNEVLSTPGEGSFAFIELKNAGGDDIELAGVVIRNERGDEIVLPSGLLSLSFGEVFLISANSDSTDSSRWYSLDLSTFLSEENGTLFLDDPDRTLLDRVSWGVDNPDSVRLSSGGVPPIEFPRGRSIGRHPLSAAMDRLEWTTYTQHQVTPGESNPMPAVEIMLPFNEALFETPEIPLAWYVVPGAVKYRVQVATDRSFAALEIDAEVEVPPVITDPLPAGTYYWRVQALSSDVGAEFSPIQSFTVEAEETSSTWVLVAYAPPSGDLAQQERRVVLPVPQIFQKKDSTMLLLESPKATGAHAWNKAHPGYSGDDPADNANCGLASIAMVNHYFGGDLTQDRIGWEVFKDRKPGPERDLNWGDGLSIFKIEEALAYALPGSLLYFIPENTVIEWQLFTDRSTNIADFFDRVVELIDNNQPVIATVPGHATLITGYRVRGEDRFFHLNDPTVGKYWVKAEAEKWEDYFVPGDEGETDDPTHFLDFDNDEINNFDEMYRFGTDPNNPDSDGDGLKDGVDVYASVHDESYGYSGDENMRGRDFDGDGRPMELDSDADDGGCMDGFEDLDRDGKHEPENDETWNFADWEDRCWKLTIDWIFSDEWGDTWIRFEGNFLVGEEREIEGWGETDFAHSGPCVTASDSFGFTIGGILEEDTLKIEIADIPEAQGPDVSDDLRCTIGETIGEAYAVSFGSGWALPEVIEVPAEEKKTIDLTTQSPLATRSGDLELTIEKLEIDYSK
jgi:hypothetical protein